MYEFTRKLKAFNKESESDSLGDLKFVYFKSNPH